MNQKLLIALVKDEARKLKSFATKEELKKLTFNGFNPYSEYDCIYGQITGNCFSERSVELISKCAKKIFCYLTEPTLAGRPNFKKQDRMSHFSPIEIFIVQHQTTSNGESANQVLIEYLQGKRRTLSI